MEIVRNGNSEIMVKSDIKCWNKMSDVYDMKQECKKS